MAYRQKHFYLRVSQMKSVQLGQRWQLSVKLIAMYKHTVIYLLVLISTLSIFHINKASNNTHEKVDHI